MAAKSGGTCHFRMPNPQQSLRPWPATATHGKRRDALPLTGRTFRKSHSLISRLRVWRHRGMACPYQGWTASPIASRIGL